MPVTLTVHTHISLPPTWGCPDPGSWCRFCRPLGSNHGERGFSLVLHKSSVKDIDGINAVHLHQDFTQSRHSATQGKWLGENAHYINPRNQSYSQLSKEISASQKQHNVRRRAIIIYPIVAILQYDSAIQQFNTPTSTYQYIA